MSHKLNSEIAVIGIDIGKNSFHVVGCDDRGTIMLRQKWSRGQVEARLANLPPSLIGMEACVGAHHLSRKLRTLGHDARLMPAKYVRPYSKGQKNDFRDAEAVAEAVQHPTITLVASRDIETLHQQQIVTSPRGVPHYKGEPAATLACPTATASQPLRAHPNGCVCRASYGASRWRAFAQSRARRADGCC